MKPNRCECGKMPEYVEHKRWVSDETEYILYNLKCCDTLGPSIDKDWLLMKWNHTHDGWVDCKTALPEEFGRYLTYAQDVNKKPEYSVWTYGADDWFLYGICSKPSHWRDLPDLPEENSNEKQ